MRELNRKEDELLAEIEKLRHRVSELERLEIEHRKAGEALCESEELNMNILNASAVGLAYAKDRKVIWANETMVNMFGFIEESEYVGRETSDLYATEEEYYRVGKLVYRALQSGKAIETDSKFRRRDGFIFYGHIRVSVFDPSNPMKGIIVNILDITERKRNEQILRESEEKYRTILENVEDGYYEVDLKGNMTFFNDKTALMIGHSKKELLGMNNRQYMDDLNAKKVFNVFNNVFRTGRPTKAFDWELVRKDGTKIYIEVSVSLKVDHEGNPVGFRGLFRDITGRKRAEEMLKRERQAFHIIAVAAVHSSDIIDLCHSVLKDLVETLQFDFGTIRLYKEEENILKIVAIVGLSDEEKKNHVKFLSIDNSDYISSYVARNRLAIFAPDIKKHDLYKSHKSRVDKLGVRSIISWPIIDSSQKLLGIMNLVVREGESGGKQEMMEIGISDRFFFTTVMEMFITALERKRAEESLRKSEMKYRDLIENAVDLIFTTDTKGNFLEVNEAFFRNTGYGADEIIGKNFFDYLVDEDKAVAVQAYKITRRGITHNFEMRAKKKDGNIAWCSFVTRPILDQDGEVASIHFIARNVTEKKRLEEELFEAQKMKAIGTLAGGIAHDFNNIMATILGYASYLRGKLKKDDRFYKGLVAIEKSAIRASELTAHLLAYSRKGKLEIKPININMVVKDVNEIISGIFEKSIKIVLSTEHNLENIEGDITQMNQVVMNLAINAREAMPEGGILKIQTFMEDIDNPIHRAKYTIKPGRYVCLKVSDNGVGMDKNTEMRIFEPYFSTKPDKTSTGLGMSVVYGIVKGHSGYIEVGTEPGEGTEITIYIPASTEKVEIEDVKTKEWTGGSKTIMIIDDEGSVLSMLTSILTDAGFRILSYSSGRSAVKVFREKTDEIDLVILDVIMPDMSGEKVLKELLKIDKNVKVLLASGYSHEEQHHELLELGASGFIGKPFVINMLLDKIGEVMG